MNVAGKTFILAQSDGTALAITVGLIILLIVCVILFHPWFRFVRAIKKIQKRKISDLITGEHVRVVGKLELLDRLLVAPLSDRRCAYFQVEVDLRKGGGNGSYWSNIINKEKFVPFWLTEGNSRVLIASMNVKGILKTDRDYDSGLFNDATDKLKQYLNENGYSSENIFGLNKRIQYREGVLESGEQVMAAGIVYRTTADTLGLPGSDVITVLVSGDCFPVYVSDDPEIVIK
jgi:hypothetical protein